MSNSTDTNQASEDVLIELATKFDMDEYGTVNENGGYLIGEVRKLIRTEKLKLLDRLSSHKEDLFWWTGGGYEKTKAVDMRAIAAERDKLAKMEAEL